MDIGKGLLVLFIYDQLYLLFGNFSLLKIFFNEFASLVRRTIVDVNYMVIAVILHENWVQISQKKTTFWTFVLSKLNFYFSVEIYIMDNFCHSYGLNMYLLWYAVNFKVVLKSVSLEIRVLNNLVDWSVKKVFILISFYEREKLQWLIRFFS